MKRYSCKFEDGIGWFPINEDSSENAAAEFFRIYCHSRDSAVVFVRDDSRSKVTEFHVYRRVQVSYIVERTLVNSKEACK